jgi:hypothetical protein
VWLDVVIFNTLFTADPAQFKANIAVSISGTGVEVGNQMSLRKSYKIPPEFLPLRLTQYDESVLSVILKHACLDLGSVVTKII